MHFQSLALTALVLITPAFAASNVLELTPSNFDSELASKPALVEFFAPWCGHCKKLAPTWEELADSFASAKSKIAIAKVDGDEHKSLSTKYGISGFPTIKYFPGSGVDPIDYTGGRDLESFQNYIAETAGTKAKKVGQAPSDVLNLGDKDFDKAIGKDKGVFVAFTAPWCGHCKSLAPTWESLAHDFNGDASSIAIAKVDAEANTKVAETYGVSSYPTIKYFPAGSKEPLDYTLGRDINALIGYVNEKTGLHRLPGGGLDLKAGTVEALNSLVQGVSGKNVDEVLAEVMKAAKGATDTGSSYYVKVLEKVKANTGYLEKESSRLQGLLVKGGLAKPKEDDLTRRLNILKAFMKGEKSTGELMDDIKEEL